MSLITHHPSGRGDDVAGKLAATLLSVAVAGMAEPGRFRRGKTYLVDNAVLRVEVQPGLLRAEVIGSRSEPYHVQVHVPVVELPDGLPGRLERQHATVLVPDSDEIDTECTCPDDDEPCKHAVAALLVLAQELPARPQLLVEWRAGAVGATRPAAGARARTGRHLRLVSNQSGRRVPSTMADVSEDDLAAFEGHDLDPPDIAALFDALPPMRVAVAPVDGIDVAGIVAGAQARLVARPPA
jgi:SWIM zinc finger